VASKPILGLGGATASMKTYTLISRRITYSLIRRSTSQTGGDQLRDDPRWKYGVPPIGNANYAWLQHMISHLSPRGLAGVVLANGSLSSQQSGEGDIRRRLIEADLVECIVTMPGQLFYSTPIPASLWFLNRDKTPGGARAWRDRRGEVLFVDARKLGILVDRTHREFGDGDMAHSWHLPRLAW